LWIKDIKFGAPVSSSNGSTGYRMMRVLIKTEITKKEKWLYLP